MSHSPTFGEQVIVNEHTVFENMKFTNTSSNATDNIFAAFVFTVQRY